MGETRDLLLFLQADELWPLYCWEQFRNKRNKTQTRFYFRIRPIGCGRRCAPNSQWWNPYCCRGRSGMLGAPFMDSLRLDVRFLAVRPLSATNHFHFRFFSFMKKISGQNENDHAGLLDQPFEIL